MHGMDALWAWPLLLLYMLAIGWVATRLAMDWDGRGQPGWIVGILVFFAPWIGIPVWAVFRRPSGTTTAPDDRVTAPVTRA